MTEPRHPRLERILERILRAVSGGGLHPIEILQAVQSAAREAARDGLMPNQFEVLLHPREFAAYRPALAELREELEGLLTEDERQQGLSRIGVRTIRFRPSGRVLLGHPRVEARFAAGTTPTNAPSIHATVRIRRHTAVEVVLGDGSRVTLDHTPFTIGRSPDNDLVLLSLAVSRNHAVIVDSGDGFEIVDRESRNGLKVDGRRVERAPLSPGRTVVVGDVALSLRSVP